MIEIVLAVWLVMSSIGGRTYPVSEHLTESACRQAAAERIETEFSYAVACVEGLRKYRFEKPAPAAQPRGTYRTTPAKEGTCTGDDGFCGRIPQ